MKERQPCEAPIHSANCPCVACATQQCRTCHELSEDHFTPVSIAKKFKWNRKTINGDSNLQYLSRACHRDKDFTTPMRLDLVRRQLAGEEISLEEYQQVVLSQEKRRD